MDQPQNQPPIKRRTAYVLRLQQKAREQLGERFRVLAFWTATLILFTGGIYFILSVTTSSARTGAQSSSGTSKSRR